MNIVEIFQLTDSPPNKKATLTRVTMVTGATRDPSCNIYRTRPN